MTDIPIYLQRHEDGSITVQPTDGHPCPECGFEHFATTTAFSSEWGSASGPAIAECDECGTEFELRAVESDCPDELQELYNWVYERAEEHKEGLPELSEMADLDGDAMQVGKYYAYDRVREELLHYLDSEAYELIRGGGDD